MATLSVGGTTIYDTTLGFPTGHIIQVLQAQKTDAEQFTSPTDTFATVTGLSQAITLNHSSNKVMLMHHGNYGTDDTYYHFLRFARGGTGIGVGDASSSRRQAGIKLDWGDDAAGDAANTRAVSMVWLDTPGSVGPHTYTVQYSRNAGTLSVNRSDTDTDNDDYGRLISTLTLWEIVG